MRSDTAKFFQPVLGVRKGSLLIIKTVFSARQNFEPLFKGLSVLDQIELLMTRMNSTFGRMLSFTSSAG